MNHCKLECRLIWLRLLLSTDSSDWLKEVFEVSVEWVVTLEWLDQRLRTISAYCVCLWCAVPVIVVSTSLIVFEVICTACVGKLCFGHFLLSLIVFWLWSPHVVGDCLFVAKDRYRADGAPNVTAVRVLWCWTVNWLMKLWWMWLLCNAVLVTAMHRMCRRLSVYVQRSVVKWWWTLRASRQSLLSL